MAATVQLHRGVLTELVRSPLREFWIVSPRIDRGAAAHLLRYLTREDVQLFVLTDLSHSALAAGQVEPAALLMLQEHPGCEVRSLPGLAATVYAAGPDGPAVVTGAPLTMDGLDGPYQYGLRTPDGDAVLADLRQWWAQAALIGPSDWAAMAEMAQEQGRIRNLKEEIARIGAFVRVSVRGTKRSRRLDPREFGVAEENFSRAIRPVEMALYRLDDVIRAKEELESVLAENGLEWNGHYLVPRHFLENEWPRLFALRQQALMDRLKSPEGREALRVQVHQARQGLEQFLGLIYPYAETKDLSAEVWIDQQATRVLTEAVSDSVLDESTLEYRVLTILPEDERSVEEVERLLQDPKLRSVQLTFNF